MSKLKIFITFSLFIFALAPHCGASNYDRDYIINFAKKFVEQNTAIPSKGKIVVSPASIDPRITIKPCSVPLSANIPENYSSRNVNVKISCVSSTPWHIFLPVKVKTTIPVLVTKNKISKGSVLDESNMTIEWRDLYKVRGEIIENEKLIVGAKTKRTLMQGAVISKKNICVVCKGERVVIIAQSKDFVIKTAGVALKNGTFGEHINVKNTRSGRTINAQVKAINKVLINL